jgi:hypothetical protein
MGYDSDDDRVGLQAGKIGQGKNHGRDESRVYLFCGGKRGMKCEYK